MIVIFDLLIHLFAVFFAYLIRFDLKADFSLIEAEWAILSKSLWYFIIVKLVVFGLFQIQQGIVENEYFSAVTAHSTYFRNQDVLDFIIETGTDSCSSNNNNFVKYNP